MWRKKINIKIDENYLSSNGGSNLIQWQGCRFNNSHIKYDTATKSCSI